MARAKDLVVKPISSQDAARVVKAVHYSGKVVNNSQLHFGVFLNGRLEGAMQFGPSLDKRKIQGLVTGTGWNDFIELNRMAFSEALPRNSESRAMAVAFRLIKKHYPHIKWVVSFSDAAQCGDGVIYRAAGFVLTGIRPNGQIIEFPDGLRETRLVLTDARRPRRLELAKKYGVTVGGASSLKPFLDIGAKAIDGFQLRYIYFLDPAARERLTVPVLPFSKISEMGAGMYRGKPIKRPKQATSGDQSDSGGAAPTRTLQNTEARHE
jgi:hypothetical protein